MDRRQPDWRQLFGSVDVSAGGSQPPSTPPSAPTPPPPAPPAISTEALLRSLPQPVGGSTVRIAPAANAPIVPNASMPAAPGPSRIVPAGTPLPAPSQPSSVQAVNVTQPPVPAAKPNPPPQPSVNALDALFTSEIAGFGSNVQAVSAPPQANNVASPSMMQMATSFGTSMAKFAASGFKTVSREFHDARFAVCKTCDQHTGSQCKACGCFTDKKAWMPHEDCPLGRWPKAAK